MPVRVQLSRAKGWRMPPDTVKVDRSTKWGNQHVVVLDEIRYTGEDDEAGEPIMEGPWLCKMQPDKLSGWWFPTKEEALAKSLELYRWELTDAPVLRCVALREQLPELHDQNIGCWCALDQPCHGDVLLELANPPSPPGHIKPDGANRGAE